MSSVSLVFLSHDVGLLEHWRRVFRAKNAVCIDRFSVLLELQMAPDALVWVDQAVPGLPAASDAAWVPLTAARRIVFASSRPRREEGIQALDGGFAGYCHAYADAQTLRQVLQVVGAGHVWVGPDIMRDLLAGVRLSPAKPVEPQSVWSIGLTEREREVAGLAANGSANRDIAAQCGITERTVKAHLAGVFAKLGVVDRLQLALRVHGIR
jgi:DNA-binding NarL/FixJ family response regulator